MEAIIFNPGKPHFRFTFIVTDAKTYVPGFLRTAKQRKATRYAIAVEHVNTCFVVTDKGTMSFPKYFEEIKSKMDTALLFQIEVKDPQKLFPAFFFALTSQITPSQRMIEMATQQIIRYAKGGIGAALQIDELLMTQATLLDSKSMLTWVLMAKDPRPDSEG